jgi:hypothetical protein
MNNFSDALRGPGFEVLKRDGFQCVYCGFDGSQTFSGWLCLSVDHLLPEEHPLRDETEYKAAACRFCNEADNQYFVKAHERGITFEGKTREELIAQRKPYVLKTRDSYLEFWRANVLESSTDAKMVRLSAKNVAIDRSDFIGSFEKKYKAELSLLEEIYELGKSMTVEIGFGSGKQQRFEGVVLFCCIRTVCALESILFLSTVGNSADTALIFRSMFETLINFLYIDKEPGARSLLFARREVSEYLKKLYYWMRPSVPLRQFPGNIVFPEPISNRISYDRKNHQLLFDGPMTENDKNLLLGVSQDPSYQEAVNRLFRSSIRPEEVAGVAQSISIKQQELSRYNSEIQSQFPGLQIPPGNNWSGKQIREMAEDVDLGYEYDTMYWELSGITHSSASSSLFFLDPDPNEKRVMPKFYPNDTISRRILRYSADYSLKIFKLVNERMGRGKESQFMQLESRLMKLFGNRE